ncbi:hypothetical protein PMIN07_006035 [Paraphaeosphaeria minitans]
MRFTKSLLLLSSSLLASTVVAQNTDSEVAASWTEQGICAFFYKKPGAWKSLAQTCVKYCENNGGHGYSECDHTPYAGMNLPNGIDQSTIMHDDSGDVYVPCKCKCDNPDVEGIANAILDVVIDGLSQLNEIICGVFMTAMVSVVETGIDLIPGGPEAEAAAHGVEAVKSFTENSLDVADSMGNWVGKACGIKDPNWPNNIFDTLLTAPDSYGKSIGCKLKVKAGCKHLDPIPDKPKKKEPHDPEPDKPKTKEPDDPATKRPVTATSAEAPPVTSDTAPPVSSDPAPPGSSDVPVSSKMPKSSDVSVSSVDRSTSVGPSVTSSVHPSTTKSNSRSTTSSAHSSSTNGTATTSTSLSSSSTTELCGAEIHTVVHSRGAMQTAVALACEAINGCIITHPDKGGEDALEDALDAVNDVTNILRFRGIDGHRSPRSILGKRALNSGKPCSSSPGNEDFVLQSDEYPSNSQLATNVDSWGYKLQNNKCDYRWQDGNRHIVGNDYDSELVMEWQTVIDFFAQMNAKGGKKYNHPDPNKPEGTKTDFCTYWIQSWSLDARQKFRVNGSAAHTPWNHIKTVYPGKTLGHAYKSEIIRLQQNIKTTPKSKMFSNESEYIWTKATMDKYVVEKKKRDKVLERMRLLLGARTYLTDPKVKAIFKKQKERMGAMIGQLDTDMQKHRRSTTVTDPDTGAVSTETFRPWVKQNLLREWNKFMDQKWASATAKHKKVMHYFIKELDHKNCKGQSKMSMADEKFCANLLTLEINYLNATEFRRPW